MKTHLCNLLILLYRYKSHSLRKKIRRKLAKLEGHKMWSPSLRLVMRKYHRIEVGYGSYGGFFDNPSSFKPGTTIGNYCSFANDIFHFNANHPYKEFTTHPLMYLPEHGYTESESLQRTSLIIENDVWIGQNAIILPNVKRIGNGAIIGAGSIVTKDIAPYTIVAGNPAKVLGKRFDEKTIEKLERSQWWLLKKEELIHNIRSYQNIVKEQQ